VVAELSPQLSDELAQTGFFTGPTLWPKSYQKEPNLHSFTQVAELKLLV
jgi:hypothetical protein